jgi:(p)ppGpp synthase/HD superfamily hydrolase
MNRLKLAHDFVVERHGDEKRKFTNRPYVLHLEETAQLLWEATDGQASDDEYIAALFHDLLENTPTTPEEIGKNYGGEVMGIVVEVTNNDAQIVILGKAVYLSKKINAMSNKAFSLKLCDRLSNVVGLQEDCIPDHFVNQYVKETQYILEHLNREMDETQKYLVERIINMLIYLRLKRNL